MGSSVKFNWEDAFNINSLLTNEERILRDSVQAFCQSNLQPRVVKDYRNELTGSPDAAKALFREFGSLGILGCTLQGYGCAGVGSVGGGLVAREIERVDSGYRSTYSVQSSLVMGTIHAFGSEEQKSKYLPELGKGNLIGCFGLTEPNAGSDVANMSTRAVYDSSTESYILNGEKTWISNAPIADLAIIWAKCNDQVKGFIIERDTPGYTSDVIKGKLGLRASVTGSIALDNVRVGKQQALPLANSYKAPFTVLNSARYGIIH
uniref:Glutaryl-CoA dehydrogenase, mitochondrial n=2 Tax=Cacopsylla melanoneura TaxID=428564 RepID=A0A8D8UHX2_9HEMI